MSFKFCAIVGACCCALVDGREASGMYIGLSVHLYTTVTVSGAARDVYRVYANFNNPTDVVDAVAGSDLVGNMTILTRNAADTGPGSAFFNPGGSTSNTAPMLPDGTLEYGTFATIGVSLASQGSGAGGADQTATTPGFPTFISGNLLNNNNMAWFTPGPVEQGRAGYAGDGDSQLRVLLMQLAVNAGEHFRSTIAVFGYHTVNLATPVAFTATDQHATSVPVPGILGLMAVAGLGRTRPRRRG